MRVEDVLLVTVVPLGLLLAVLWLAAMLSRS